MAAALLNFDPTRRRVQKSRTTGRGPFHIQDGGAKILFFTGVRVERHAEAEEHPALPQDADS